MELRDLGEKRVIRRPEVGGGVLDGAGSALEGEFDLDLERISQADQSGVIGEGRCLGAFSRGWTSPGLGCAP